MSVFWKLISSKFSVVRASLAVIALILAAKSGVWFANELFGQVAVFYSIAFGIALLSKGGSDALLSRAIRECAPSKRTSVFYKFLLGAIFRLCILSCALAFFLLQSFSIGEVMNLISLSCVILTGNFFRIGHSPNYQLGFDNSTFTIVVIIFYLLFGTSFVAGTTIFAISLFLIYVVTFIRNRPVGILEFSPFYGVSLVYLLSEMVYFLLGFGVPLLIAINADISEVGKIRSVERLAYAGSFLLLVINNRLLYDLSRSTSEISGVKEYIKKYSFPASSFCAMVITVLLSAAYAGLVPNISSHLEIFILYAIAFLISSACGPVSGYLNFLGYEKYVLSTGLLGAAVVLICTGSSISNGNYLLVVFGAVAGICIVNLTQLIYLFHKLNNANNANKA